MVIKIIVNNNIRDMKINKEQHAINVKGFMLNTAEAVYKAILRGDDPRDDKKFIFYIKKTNEYLEKHKLFK